MLRDSSKHRPSTNKPQVIKSFICNVTGDYYLKDTSDNEVKTKLTAGIQYEIDDLVEVLQEVAIINSEIARAVLTVVARPASYVKKIAPFREYTVATQPLNNVQSSKEITLTGVPLTAVTNRYAAGSLQIDTNPLPAVGNVDATGTLTVSGTPIEGVTNISSFGTLTISDTPVNNETFLVDDVTFTFKTTPVNDLHVAISANNTTQAGYIKAKINDNLGSCIATGDAAVLTVSSVVQGSAGDGIIKLTSSATGLTVTDVDVTDFLTGGRNAVHQDTTTVGTQVFNFVAVRSGLGEITISAVVGTQAANIETAVELDIPGVVSVGTVGGVCTFTSVVHGAAGNLVVLSEDATGIAVSNVTDGKLKGGISVRAMETFNYGGTTYKFVPASGGVDEITIGATVNDTATNVDTILGALTSVDPVVLNRVIFTTGTPGTAGNAVVLANISTVGCSFRDYVEIITVAGVLSGGRNAVNADTITFDTAGTAYTFITGASSGHNIQIGSDIPTSIAKILLVTPDTANYTLIAGSTTAKFKVQAVAVGVAGDGIISEQIGTSFTGVGATTGGVNADTLVIGSDTYTFLANGSSPAALKIVKGTTAALTNTAIVALGTLTDVVITEGSTTSKFIVTHKVVSAVNNGYVVTPDGTRITGTANLAGGVTEVKNTIIVGTKEYIFCLTAGANPVTEYPTFVQVTTAGAASVTDVAAAIVVALKLDTANFSNTSVSNTDGVITVNYKTAGAAGNIAYENKLATPGNITDSEVADGKFTGGIDEVPAHNHVVDAGDITLVL